MEVAESRETTSVGPPAGVESTVTNGEHHLLIDEALIDDDDGRSSSLSEIDDVSENMVFDLESPKPEKAMTENDSEAETERIEDSPNNIRLRNDIVVSATNPGPSPSKLAQSTTYDEVEDGEQVPDDSPSKPRSKNNQIPDLGEETPGLDELALSEGIGKKRKRHGSTEELGTELDEDEEPPQKRRGSLKSELSDPPAEDIVLTPEPIEEEPIEEPSKPNEEDTPVDDIPESDLPAAPAKGRKSRKGKRKGRKARDVEEDTDMALETGVEGGGDDLLGDEEAAERGEEADDGEAAAKLEEESAKRVSAMESLAVLEREFAALRDKIYDERVSKLNRELEMLNGPNPTHPEFLRQLECIQRYRDAKIKYEHTLYQYRIKALLNKSLAERAQAHSTYFQRARDVREKHSSAISKQFYAIQHDRFKTDEVSPQHFIPFPTRRSQQIANQTAYNQEVSILAGVAKYVGFPAAPSLSAARPTELEDDMEKMGISIETRVPTSHHHQTLPRGALSSLSSTIFHTAAEEAFLEQTPWANPQHPIHQQQQIQPRPQSRVFENPRAPAYATPAAQKRVVDIHAPNGSASTIAENSSANNTPYDHEQPTQGLGPYGNPEYDADRRSGFRSLSSSPLDVRKPHPSSYSTLDNRSPPHRNAGYSPPPARLGLFQSKRDSSPPPPPLPSKPVNSIHHHGSTGVLGGSGSNQMTAR